MRCPLPSEGHPRIQSPTANASALLTGLPIVPVPLVGAMTLLLFLPRAAIIIATMFIMLGRLLSIIVAVMVSIPVPISLVSAVIILVTIIIVVIVIIPVTRLLPAARDLGAVTQARTKTVTTPVSMPVSAGSPGRRALVLTSILTTLPSTLPARVVGAPHRGDIGRETSQTRDLDEVAGGEGRLGPFRILSEDVVDQIGCIRES